MKNIKQVSIFSAGMFLGISSLFFVGQVQKNGFPPTSHAQTPTPTPTLPPAPVICAPGCTINNSNGDMPTNELKGRDYRHAYLVQVVIQNNVDFSNSKFNKADLLGSRVSSVNFDNVDFANANLSSSQITSNTYISDNFTGASITNANIGLSDFTNADFTNANLTGSSFAQNTFTGAIWSNTTCADGTNSNSNGNTCVGHLNGQ